MLGYPQDLSAQMQNINRLGAGAGFGARAPLNEEAIEAKSADIDRQIEELTQRRIDLAELAKLMSENPGATQLVKLCQRLGFL